MRASRISPHSLIVAMRFPFPEKTQNFGAAENRDLQILVVARGDPGQRAQEVSSARAVIIAAP